jgi:subtilase family serine protease
MAVRRVAVKPSAPDAHPYEVATPYAAGPSGGYTPTDLAGAYGYDPTATPPTTQTVAVVDAFDNPNMASDLNAFDSQYGLPPETSLTFSKVNQDGDPFNLPAASRAWAIEEALDVETVRAVCNACQIVLVEADSSRNSDLAAAAETAANPPVGAANPPATEISNSFGSPEPNPKHVSKHVIQSLASSYNHPGIVVTAATGDDGWFSWDAANAGGTSLSAPNMPSSFARVVAVGGTKLTLNSNGTRRNETVWNHNGPADANGIRFQDALGATGGGCSRWITAPTWQAHVGGYHQTGCGKKRLAADIAADADPDTGFDIFTGFHCADFPNCWATYGGTSLSSPLIAGMWALAGGSGGVRYPGASLYAHARSRFFDVTAGGNAWCGGLTHKTCARRTGKETRGHVKNPNFLSNGHQNLGMLDCSFKPHTAKTTHLKTDHQCKAATGYDGPTGRGTPIGLTVFRPVP